MYIHKVGRLEEGLSFTLSGIGVLALVVVIFISLNLMIPMLEVNKCYERGKIAERLQSLSGYLHINAAIYLKWVRRC